MKVNDPEKIEMKSIDAFVSPGTMALLLTSRTRIQMHPIPYSDCRYVNSIHTNVSEKMQKLNITYSKINCYLTCQQMILAEKFSCQFFNLPKVYDNVAMCANRTIFEQISALPNEFFDTCIEWCPNECIKETYDFSKSTLEYPSYVKYVTMINSEPDFALKYFNTPNITYEIFAKSVAKVFVTFKEIKYTEILETPAFTLVDLISNIGGTMGLFIGFSFMICVEFIELGIQLVLVALKKRRSKVADETKN